MGSLEDLKQDVVRMILHSHFTISDAINAVLAAHEGLPFHVRQGLLAWDEGEILAAVITQKLFTVTD